MDERVWQRGFGWVRLKFAPDAIEHGSDEPEFWQLAEAGGIIASLAGIFLFGGGAAVQYQVGDQEYGTVLAGLALLTGYYALKKGFQALIEHASFVVIILIGLFLVPFRRGRRRIREWWDGEDLSRRRTPYRQVRRLSVYWFFGTHVTVRRHGERAVKLRAVGDKGRRLADAMRRVTPSGS